MSEMTIEAWGRTWELDPQKYRDLSLPINRNGGQAQPRAFSIPAASITPLRMGDWEGSLKKGSSVNVDHLQITAHGAGTHTECLAHITGYPLRIHQVPLPALIPGLLCSVADHKDIGRDELKKALDAALENKGSFGSFNGCALIIRRKGLSPESLQEQDYSGKPTPVFVPEALEWAVALGFEHLLTDLPSLDPEQDQGKLLAHRAWWGLPASGSLLDWKPDKTKMVDQRALRSTITEFIAVPKELPDGPVFLQLGLLPLESDACPSRPLLFIP